MVDLHEVLAGHADSILERAGNMVGAVFPVEPDISFVGRILTMSKTGTATETPRKAEIVRVFAE